jgi:CrcB protein
MDSTAMTTALLVALGSALGAPTRFLVDQYFKKYTDHPVGTFLVNVIGSFFIGLTFSSTEHWHDFVAIGFAGSFTTWSTFMLDLYLGVRLKRYKSVSTNFFASIIFGLIAEWLGVTLVN